MREVRREQWKGRSKRPEREELHRLYVEEGMSQYEIARQFDVGQSLVSFWMQEMAIPARQQAPKKPRVPKPRSKAPAREELERLYVREGKTQDQIAEVYGVTQSAVGDWFTKAGIEARSRRKRPERDELVMALAEHSTQMAVAKLYNVTPAAVTAWMKLYGLESRKGSEPRATL